MLAGVPGLSDIPLIGRLFARNRKESHADRHHPDADAAHRAHAAGDGSGPPAVPARPRQCGGRRGTARPISRPYPQRAARFRPSAVRAASSRSGSGPRFPQPLQPGTHISVADAWHGGPDRAACSAEEAGRRRPLNGLSRDVARPARRATSGVRRARHSRARRSRAGPPSSPLPPPAPRQSAPSRIGCRGCRDAARAACVGPLTMMRCGSQRNRSARIALSCSSANSRSSYIQSCTSVSPSACVASTVTRLTMSLGNPGHRPVVIRRAAVKRRRLARRSARRPRSTRGPSSSAAPRRPRCRSSARPSPRCSPPVIAATTPQLPASM